MIAILTPVFLLTTAMAGGVAYFVGRFMIESATRRRLLRAAVAALSAGLLFPPLYFGLYMLAKPQDDSDPAAVVTPEAALIPAVWLGLLLLGAALGLWRAARHRPLQPPPDEPS